MGRVDRLGQQRTVHAIHLYHRGSFEDVVLGHLERRRARTPTPQLVNDPSISVGGLQIERRLRALVAGCSQSDIGAGPLYSRKAPRERAVGHIVLLFATDVVDGTGRMVERQLIPLRVEPPVQTVATRTLSKALVRQLAMDWAVRATLDREVRVRLASLRVETSHTAIALEQRARELAAHLESRQQNPLFQGSLFDRHAEQQSQARAASQHAWRDHFARRIDAAHALTVLRASDPRLLAAWLAE